MSASLGLSSYPFVPEDPGLLSWENVLAIADDACYLAKENKRNAWVAIYRGERVGTKDLYSRIKRELATLARQKVLLVSTSVRDRPLTFGQRPGHVL